MKERLNFRQLIAVASMLFGLFFGAGNLIFPVHMGQLAGANSYVAAIGFIVTAVGCLSSAWRRSASAARTIFLP